VVETVVRSKREGNVGDEFAVASDYWALAARLLNKMTERALFISNIQ
jgi:hypothetical protein